MKDLKVVHAIEDKTADYTSDAILIAGADKVSFVFKGDVTSGNGVFAVEVSADGENWVSYNKLIDNVINSISENLTRVASKTVSTDTQVYVSMSPEDCYQFIRVSLNMTTDGTYNAWVLIQR